MTVTPIRIGIVGMGKIARDQHLPAIGGDPSVVLAATVSRNAPGVAGVPHYTTLDALLRSDTAVDAVALCTPPQARYSLAATALDRGLHVFLEKPPGATLSEVAALEALAKQAGVTLFASWHSRHAAGVAQARAWLADRQVESVSIVWREDVRVWHPGQDWIWEPGGLGVFDPGINALSIATEILPRPFFLQSATLFTPANRQAPIAANLAFRGDGGAPITMDLDWRQTGTQTWEIVVKTPDGRCALSQGGAVLAVPGGTMQGEDREYPALYAAFMDLIRTKRSHVDTRPLRLVADAFLCGRHISVEAFEW